jgi:uncharacterized protein (DUF488 family)
MPWEAKAGSWRLWYSRGNNSTFTSSVSVPAECSLRLWTVGHSNRSQAEFIELLAQYKIEAVADVRRHPASRRLPYFAGAVLETGLLANNIAYLWLPGLGGRRRPLPNSLNTAWRSASFRGFADYMQTEAFAESLTELVTLGCAMRTAVMCAEAVWWRCHRGLIADALRWMGIEVIHILGPGSHTPHPYTPAASIVGGRLSYTKPGV